MTLALRVRRTRIRFELDVEIELPSSGITAVFGRSGCGKTTLLRAIAGLDRVPGALVRFDDAVWQDERSFVPPHRRELGYVFQESSLFAHLDVRQNLEYGLHRRSHRPRQLGFDEGVALLGLDSLLERRPHELSGGERQRVAIGRALLASPRLLLMDEPVSSLDETGRGEVLGRLEGLRERLSIPVVYVSHALREVTRLADHLLLLEAGKVRAAGPLRDLLTRGDLPLADFEASGAVLEGVLEGHDPVFHLSFVATAAGRLALSRRELEPGARVRVRIDARDVSVALDPPTRSSISNVLPARVLDLSADPDPAQVRLRLAAGGELLVARITRRSAVQLGLEPGTPVYAQIKSVALME